MVKMDEYTKFALTIGLLPWIPAYIFYKHALGFIGVQIIILFLLLALICFIYKDIAKQLKDILSAAGDFSGKYIAMAVLAVVYIAAVIPTGLLMKIKKRDRLRLKKPDLPTYWVDYENNNTDYEYQF